MIDLHNHSARERLRTVKLENGLGLCLREDTQPAADSDGKDHQAQLVDQAGLDQRVHQRAAAGDEDRPAVSRLELGDGVGDIAFERGRVALYSSSPDSVVDATCLGIAFILSANSPFIFGHAFEKPS